MSEILEIFKENLETIILSIIAIANSILNIKNNIQLNNTQERKQIKLAKKLKKVEKQQLKKVNEIKKLELKKGEMQNEINSSNENQP